jgi:hypothetical protein
MGYRGRPNCTYLDNWRLCSHPALRLKDVPWWLAWLFPKGRPACILDYPTPQDGENFCPYQNPRPRPPPPRPQKAP